MLAVTGDTATVIEGAGGGGGGGDLVLRAVAEHPARISIASMLASWISLRIFEDTHREPLKTECSVTDGHEPGYWPKGQYVADVRG